MNILMNPNAAVLIGLIVAATFYMIGLYVGCGCGCRVEDNE